MCVLLSAKMIASIDIQKINVLFVLSLKQTMRNMKKLRLWAFTLLLASTLFLPMGIASEVPFADVPFDVTNIPEPVPPPPVVRDFFQLDPYYQQWINVRGFPVLASAEVSPYAVKEAAWTIGHMVGHRPDILKAMAQIKARFSIVPHNKHLSDIPEYGFGRLDFFWEIRARGIGGLTTTSPEENIICGYSNYCYAELIHEFAHQLHGWGLNRIDSTFDSRLETLYNAALKEGLYQERYAGSNRWEYWAEGVGSWFNGPNRDSNVAHTRLALKKYDPRLATLLTEVFGDGSWRYTPPATRTDLPHLQGFNPQEAPIYQRPPELLELKKQLRDPNSDGGGKWVNLKLYDPSGLSHLKKLTTGRNRTEFLFGKLTGTDLALYFFNADGKKKLHQYITVADFLAVHTVVGAIWLIQDHTGKDLAVFRAEKEVGRVLITPTLHLIKPGLSKVSGDNQTGVSGALLANPFIIELNDENLSVLKEILVTFTVTAGDGTLSVTSTTTDEKGRAESVLTLGPNPGTNTVSVSAAGIEGTATFNAVAEAAVDLLDSSLRAAIETTLGKASGAPITASDMARLTRLEAGNADISDLTGLEFATNLTNLNLGAEYVEGRPINSNSVSDISPLVGLTNLTGLDLGSNTISNISPVAGLTNLTELNLWGNSISDISPVAGLINLTQLDLDGNALSDISAVAGLTNLTFLDIWGTPISDISPVADLTKLTTLGLGHNNISDISPVAGLTNLTGLYLPSNHITDLSSLSNLTNLKTLWLNHNSISDLSPLVANTGLGNGDEVNVKGNPLSYLSIHTHIPILENRGVTARFDNQAHPALLKISGDDQKGASFASLSQPFVVEAQDENGSALAGVSVTFAVTAGGGMLSTTITRTDTNGRAQSTLTLGPNLGTNTVQVSASGIKGLAIFHAISDTLPTEYLLSIPAGISLIHVPLKVTEVDGVAKTITSIADLHDALGGADTVNFLIAYDYATQGWLSYFGSSDTGTSADKVLTDDIGIIAGMLAPTSVRLSGNPLGTNGTSTITLNQGINLVGLPLRDSRVTRVSDLFALDGIGDNVPVVILTDNGEFKAVGQAGDPSDILITGGQSFILTAQQAAMVAISGDGWYNTSAIAAASPIGNADLHSLLTGIQVTDTTPVLGLRGSIVDEETGLKVGGFRATIKNLSTGREATAVTTPDGAGYRLTVVDIETGRAAQIGDILEISAQSPEPFVGVQPLRYTVTAKDVLRSRVELADLVAYEIPTGTALLHNYPNPFNPETWIPYRLAEDAFVTLTIYDGSGHLVRTLDVGHRIAAVYESRSKAVYWDGRNGLGEQVASGIYFYTLTAGDYSATRRMVILK